MEDYKQMLKEMAKQLYNVDCNVYDIGDVGNEIGIAIGKHIKTEEDKRDLIDGIKHGVSLIDGTHNSEEVITKEMLINQSKQIKEAAAISFKKQIPELIKEISKLKPPLNLHDRNMITRGLHRNQITVNDIPPKILIDYNIYLVEVRNKPPLN